MSPLNQDIAPAELILPVRGGFRGDAADKRLRRNFRAIEEWALSPHRVFGSRMISPLFYQTDTGEHTFTSEATGQPFTGVGTDLYTGVQIRIDRPMMSFVWGFAEFDNTDADTNYQCAFYLPVLVGATRKNGSPLREHQTFASPGREIIGNIRKCYLNVTEPTDIAFEWGFKNTSGADQTMTVYRLRMIVAVFDAPDFDPNAEVRWTPYDTTQTAYRVDEADES